ncbi:MAG: GCN5-related N-acetyltransferase [Streptosporangiaceae bacterium]|nr:GCN5-related N-acetyltransferase [Streptosporangiaceae bacterium]
MPRTSALIGFSFGFTISAGRWWAAATPPPAGVRAAEKLAVIELVVSRPHRGRGVGRALIDRLPAGRAETYGTLDALVLPLRQGR